jgi:hypothetical protein
MWRSASGAAVRGSARGAHLSAGSTRGAHSSANGAALPCSKRGLDGIGGGAADAVAPERAGGAGR